MPDLIVTARHYAKSGVALDYIKEQCAIIERTRGIRMEINETPSGLPVKARIERGQWIADCECGGASFADPQWPYTFCFNCRSNGGHLRPVEFPDNWREIEKTLLQRPVNDMAGLTDNERVALSRPMIFVEGRGGLDRNWNPGETVEQLHEQQDRAITEWNKSVKGRK